jgi:hypothetical protein
MLTDVISANVIGDYQLRVAFEDGKEGTVDIAKLVPFRGVFAPLESPEYFAQVQIDQEVGTLCWPNGADLDPLILYAEATGTPLPGWAVEPAKS